MLQIYKTRIMIYDNIQRLVCYEEDTANVFTITNVNDLFLQ